MAEFAGCGLSARGAAATTPALTYLDQFLSAVTQQWSPAEADKDKFVVLCVAENKLSHELVQARLAACPPSAVPAFAAGYDDMRGVQRLREACAAYCERTFMAGAPPVLPEHLVVSAGCGAVLDTLMFALAEAGDGVLIPAPYYPAFDNDLKVRAGVHPLPVVEPDGGFQPTVEALGAAFEEAAARGVAPKALLLTNPSNPTGVVYDTDRLEDVLRWAFGRGLHVISDEIYANSVHAPGGGGGFVTAAAVAKRFDTEDAARNLLHTVFGFSKDFAVSGYRVGVLHTRNEGVLRAYSNVGYFCAVSNEFQHRLATVLEDVEWVAGYLAENRRRLRASYDALTGELARLGVPFTPAEAGLFVWLDLRGLLDEPTFAAERRLWGRLYEELRVLTTPGADCHSPTPGYFRLCFSAVQPEALRVAVERLASIKSVIC